MLCFQNTACQFGPICLRFAPAPIIKGREDRSVFRKDVPLHQRLRVVLAIRPRRIATVRGRCSVFLCTA
jgi:hypothetical protein